MVKKKRKTTNQGADTGPVSAGKKQVPFLTTEHLKSDIDRAVTVHGYSSRNSFIEESVIRHIQYLDSRSE